MKQIVLISFLFICNQHSFCQNVDRGRALAFSACNTAIPLAISSALFLSVDEGIFLLSSDNESRTSTLSFGYYGLIAGPSAGHFYANNSKRALSGMLIRTGVIGLTYLGAFSVLSKKEDDEGDSYYTPGSRNKFGTVFIAGHLFCLGLAVYDVYNTKSSVDEHNKTTGLRIIPNYDPFRKVASLNIGKSF